MNDVWQTRDALLGYSVGLLGLILVKILAPGFYARQNIKTPVRIAFVTVFVTQTLALILMWRIGHAGLTLATSLGACVNAALLFWFLRRGGSYRPQPGWGLFLCKLLVALGVLAALLLRTERRAGGLAGGRAVGADRAARGHHRRGDDRLLRDAVPAGLPSGRLRPPRAVTGAPNHGLAVRAVGLDAVGVEIERVLADREAALGGDLGLPLLDLGVVELLDAAALHADQVIVVRALVQLEHRLAGLEMMADQEARLLELGEHAVDGGQADVEALGQQQLVDVLGRQVPDLATLRTG